MSANDQIGTLAVVGLLGLYVIIGLNVRPKAIPLSAKVVELHITLNDKAKEDAKKTGGKLVKIGDKAICSGFFVDDRGTIMTAAHCTENVESIEVMTPYFLPDDRLITSMGLRVRRPEDPLNHRRGWSRAEILPEFRRESCQRLKVGSDPSQERHGMAQVDDVVRLDLIPLAIR